MFVATSPHAHTYQPGRRRGNLLPRHLNAAEFVQQPGLVLFALLNLQWHSKTQEEN
jgi:hypothetical protein